MSPMIYDMFYARAFHQIIGIMVSLVLFWGLLGRIFGKRPQSARRWQCLNGLLFVFVLLVIITLTVTSRAPKEEPPVLKPLASFAEARVQPEIYRAMLMNIFLFQPFGLTLPYALPQKRKRKIILTVTSALLFSAVIEFLQYRFGLGRAETDDVICNTLGCLIGTLAYKKAERLSADSSGGLSGSD